MKPLQTFIVVLLFVGAIQGLVYGFILALKSRKNKTANRFLAAILFFFSYRLFVEALNFFGLGAYDFWYHIFLEFNWVYGTLIYFFVKAYITPNFKLHLQKDWIHFLPVAIEFLWSNFIKSENFYWDGTRESLSWLGYYGYIVWMHYPTMFVISGLLILFYTTKSSKYIRLNLEKPYLVFENIAWIQKLLFILKYYALIVIAIVLIDFIFLDYAFQQFYTYPVFIGLAMITYGLGIVGFQRRNDVVFKTQNMVSDVEKKQLQQIAKNLKTLMIREKPFKNPDLSLSLLSKELEVKPYITTKCLNVIFGKKFNDFINEYRINELKELLKKPENKKFTLLSLAFEVGFNSKASFNRVVKKLTGKSPKDLKSQL